MNLKQRIRRVASTSVALATAIALQKSWKRSLLKSVNHKLTQRLCVTLTSYPPRYPVLALTIKSLLSQSIRPDVLYLWIAKGDLSHLPPDVRELESHGLVIKTCEDLRSFKKIIPLLEEGQDDYVVIADDDVFYSRDWLRNIVEACRPGEREVICTRAHRIRLSETGEPRPYLEWESEIAAGAASPLVFPTGIGGVLYPPGIFHPDVTRTDLFQALCPTTDDLWLYWMAAMNGARFRKIGPRTRPITWRNSQQIALAVSNASAGRGNDEQLQNLVQHYGLPHWGAAS